MNINTKFAECLVYNIKPDGSPQYLVLKRSLDAYIYPDIWQIVTGRVEEPESAYECALREVKEETGIIPKKFYVFPKLDQFYTPENDTINLVPTFIAEAENDVVTISNEHSEYIWANYEEAMAKIYFLTQKEILTYFNGFLKNKELFKTLIEIKL